FARLPARRGRRGSGADRQAALQSPRDRPGGDGRAADGLRDKWCLESMASVRMKRQPRMKAQSGGSVMSETGVQNGFSGARDDALGSASVLVADDDAPFRSLLGTLLRQTSGASVLAAADGIEALQLGLQFRPQVVVLGL